MSFYCNNSPLTVPITTTTRSVSHRASFYASISINERFERLGSGQEMDLFGTSVSRTSVKSQMSFVRKVYLITLLQLLFVATMMSVFIHFLPLWKEQKYLWWVVLFPATIISIVTLWQLWTQYYQISRLVRIILLCIYSFFMAFILSDLIAVIFREYGQLVITMTCFGTVSIVLFTLQKKYRFRGPMPISIGLRDVYQLNPVQILGPVAISSLISTYFVLELYYAMGFMTVDDYILAYISFHIDLAYPINCLHHVCEISENVDDFTEYFNPDPHGNHG
ncbi:hypothetical protein INT48_003228 [Thamnidium elegans]|uniref:Uncharacterized protein n=1 Tax=Thamnidium elegans TaxID=101142 RepID=A0A8H7W1F9_9FUNG|nr:hypothetical protein INT48_003228 [Thamnidium elegans]